MIFRLLVSSFIFFLISGWAMSVLWHNSPCERVAAMAAPVDWFANKVQIALEPVAGYEENKAAANAVEYESSMRNFFAKWLYSREGGYAHLCNSDPIFIMKRANLLDHRGLLKKELYGKGFSLTVSATGEQAVRTLAPPKNSAQPQNAGTNTPTQGEQEISSHVEPTTDTNESWFNGKMISILLVGVAVIWGLFKFMAADNKFKLVVEGFSRPIKDIKQLVSHVLPRSAIIPDSSNDRTDKTK